MPPVEHLAEHPALAACLDELVARRDVHHALMAVRGGDGTLDWRGVRGDTQPGGPPLTTDTCQNRACRSPRTRRPARRGGPMDERTLFTNFWIEESATTRRVFERIPEGSTYRPDPRSRTAQEIAWQIVCEARLIIDALEKGSIAWTPEPMPATMAEVLAAYDAHAAGMGDKWRALPEERWSGTLDFGGRERPASAMAWSFLFDIVHHRGQITTYLRPMGSTVPQVYGPTADEP